MRVTPFTIIMFFVCLNIGFYIMNESNLVGDINRSPYETPSGIMNKLIYVDLSTENLLIGVMILGAGTLFGLIKGNLIYGGTVAIFLAVIDLVVPIMKWVIFGFPSFLSQIGVPYYIYTSVSAVMSVIWCWFFLSLIAQRELSR